MFLRQNFMRMNRDLRHFCSKNVANPGPTVTEKVAGMSPQELVKNVVKVSDWNKMLLVFAGRFKTVKDVPDYLPYGTVDKGRNRVRVKVCNYMIVATVIGSFYMVWSGKKAAEEGDTVEKRNLDWHREYNERAQREEEAAAALAKTKTE